MCKYYGYLCPKQIIVVSNSSSSPEIKHSFVPATVEDSYIIDTLSSPLNQMEMVLINKSQKVIQDWRQVRTAEKVSRNIAALCAHTIY